MRIYGKNDLRWNEDVLYLKDAVQCYLVQDKKHKKMYWTKWPDGSMSSDYVNYTRAKEWSVRMTLRELNNGVEEENYDTQEIGTGEALDAIK